MKTSNFVTQKVVAFLSNSSLMMLTAVIVVLAIGGFPHNFPITNGDISMISLILMMTLSLSSIELRSMKIGSHKKTIRNAFILSFMLCTIITLAMAFLFRGDLRSGWILEAAVPSAVSVISFTYLWGGHTEASAVSSIFIYALSLAVTPFITLIFLGKAVSEATLLTYVGLEIFIPIALSRVIKQLVTSAITRNIFINICFFVLVIAITGANRALIFSSGIVVLVLAALAIIRTFGVGTIYSQYCFKKGMDRRSTVHLTLFSTYKNTGMAASLALVLLKPEAALPAAVCMVVEVFWLIFAGKFLFPYEKHGFHEASAS
jgi:BASS family bile acid:Na+ symporter